MPPTDAVVAVKPVVAALDQLGVKHFIGGSVASGSWTWESRAFWKRHANKRNDQATLHLGYRR